MRCDGAIPQLTVPTMYTGELIPASMNPFSLSKLYFLLPRSICMYIYAFPSAIIHARASAMSDDSLCMFAYDALSVMLFTVAVAAAAPIAAVSLAALTTSGIPSRIPVAIPLEKLRPI